MPPAWNDRLGSYALTLFALLSFLGKGGAYAALLLVAVATVIDRRSFVTALRSDPVVILFFFSSVTTVISVTGGAFAQPASTSAQIGALFATLQLWLFLAVAWWTKGQQKVMLRVLLLAAAGFVIGSLRALDGEDLHALLAMQRPHFRWSINAIGHYSAAGLLGFAIMTPRVWRQLSEHPWRWVGVMTWGCLGILLALGTILSLSRGVWLSFVLVSTGLGLYALLSRNGRRSPSLRAMVITGAGVLASLGVVATIPALNDRLVDIFRPFAELAASGWDLDSVTDMSFRDRGRMLLIAFESWKASPWFGMGPAAPSFILEANIDRLIAGGTYSDFHNLAMDLLVGYGVLGTLALALLFAHTVRALNEGHRMGCIDRDLYLLLIGLLFFNVLCQMTDTRILDSHGRFFWLIVAGCAYGCRVAARARSS